MQKHTHNELTRGDGHTYVLTYEATLELSAQGLPVSDSNLQELLSNNGKVPDHPVGLQQS